MDFTNVEMFIVSYQMFGDITFFLDLVSSQENDWRVKGSRPLKKMSFFRCFFIDWQHSLGLAKSLGSKFIFECVTASSNLAEACAACT